MAQVAQVAMVAAAMQLFQELQTPEVAAVLVKAQAIPAMAAMVVQE